MRLPVKTFFCCLFFFLSQAVFAQKVNKHLFKEGVKGVAFDQMIIYQTKPLANGGVRVFLALQRKGSVQEKKIMGWAGGKEEINLTALGVVDFSSDLQVLSETLSFDTPEGVTSSEFTILDGTFKSGIPATIATQDDCVKSQGEWIRMFGLSTRPSEDKELGERPGIYYKTTIIYKGLAFKPQKIVSEKNILTGPEEAPEAQKNFFQLLWDGGSNNNGIDYESSKKEIEWEPYRGSTKTDFWQMGSEPVSDPATGNVLAHHYRVVTGEYGNRSQLFLGEVVGFDATGKELNRTELTFEKPMQLQLEQAFFDGEDNSAVLRGWAHVYAEQFGFGFKKLNPNPNEMLRKFYHWDANGKLVMQVNFDAPHPQARCVRLFEAAGGVSLLMATATDLYTLFFKDNQLVSTEKFNLKDQAGSGMAFSGADLQYAKFLPRQKLVLPDGSSLHFLSPYTVQKGSQVGAPTNYKYKGLMVAHIGAEGKLQHLRGIERSRLSNLEKGHGFYLFSKGQTYCGFSMMDPMLSGKNTVSIHRLDWTDFQMKEIYTAEVWPSQKRNYYPESGIFLMCRYLPEQAAFELALVKP